MVFVVLEGFSGTGKTTLAKRLEERGWVRFEESAHAVRRKAVPVAERADTYADISLMGATLVNSFGVSRLRKNRRVVSEGYLLSDLAYARIRYDLGRSAAFPCMLRFCREAVSQPALRPDLYILLKARTDTISARQKKKNQREKNLNRFFRERYYSSIAAIHRRLGERKVVPVDTDSDTDATLKVILSILKKRGLDR